MANLVDLDELALRCRDEQARQYIDEAVRCYKAGAYRSCIVSTWNAVVFDYLHKLRELEMSGDKNAQLILENFEVIRTGGDSKLKEALDFERNVLEVAASGFELLTPLEKIDLKRIQDDRNRCAHPSMQSPEAPYHPTAELARSHMRNAVEILLEKEPVQGKAAFARICAEIKSMYFPENKDDAINHFRSGPLNRARKGLLRSLLCGITISFLNEELENDERKRQIAAIGAIIEMHRGVSEEIFRADMPQIFRRTDDKKLLILLLYCRRISFAWDVLDAATKGRVSRYLATVEEINLVLAIAYAMDIPELKDMALTRITSIPAKELCKIIAAKPLREYIPFAIDHFSGAGSYRSAEFLGQSLILPLSSLYTNKDINDILLAVKGNGQIWDAGGMPEILLNLLGKTLLLQSETTPAWQDLLIFLKDKRVDDYFVLEKKMSEVGMWPV